MSMHETLARSVIEPEHKRGIFSSREKEAAEFLRNPPKTIFVPDCYIPDDPEKARAFMEIRCSLAANVLLNPHLYSLENQPVIIASAGTHEEDEAAGSEKVAGLLIDRGVPPEQIIALKTTITGSGDTTQLHAIHKTRDVLGQPLVKGPLMIAVDNHYARRVRQLAINHERAHRNFYSVRVYIIHPSHPAMDGMIPSSDISPEIKTQIEKDISLGQSGELKHGWKEDVAWALSAIPVLRPFQQLAEERGHEDMRHKEQSRYVAGKMKDAARRLRFYRRIIESDGHPYRSAQKGKVAPDEDSAMALASGLYTRIEDRGGPNDKESKIQDLTAKILRFPDMPAHG